MEKPESYYATFGAVALPGKKPGFVALLGMSTTRHNNFRDIFLIDEFEHDDTRTLLRKLGPFNDDYQPERWIGDNKNNAARSFLGEMNSERNDLDSQFDDRDVYLTWSQILEDDNPYQRIIPEIKILLPEENRRLYLGDSLAKTSLSNIKPDEIYTLKPGDFPAIEALGMAVIEMRVWERLEYESRLRRHRPRPEDYNWRLGRMNRHG